MGGRGRGMGGRGREGRGEREGEEGEVPVHSIVLGLWPHQMSTKIMAFTNEGYM